MNRNWHAPAKMLLGILILTMLVNACARHGSYRPQSPAQTQRPSDPQRDGAPAQPIDIQQVPDAVVTAEPRSRAGNSPSYAVFGKTYHVLDDAIGFTQRGIASWYGTKFHGRLTANGETYDMYAMSAAHRSLPIPTYLEVTNLENQRRVIVRVNDRGPFHDERVLDLSYAAAAKLDILASGTAPVAIRALHTAQPAVQPPIFLQIASFAEKNNALQLSHKIHANENLPVRISSTETRYRVQVGPAQDAEQAAQFTQILASLGYADPIVVID